MIGSINSEVDQLKEHLRNVLDALDTLEGEVLGPASLYGIKISDRSLALYVPLVRAARAALSDSDKGPQV